MIVTRFPIWEIVGEQVPLATQLHDIQNGIDDPFARMNKCAAVPIARLKMVLNQSPFGVCQIARVSHGLSITYDELLYFTGYFLLGSVLNADIALKKLEAARADRRLLLTLSGFCCPVYGVNAAGASGEPCSEHQSTPRRRFRDLAWAPDHGPP
jgi:hypothetical protein